MPRSTLLAGFALLFACTAHAADRGSMMDVPTNSAVLGIWQAAASEPPNTRLLVGDDAPSFSFLSADGEWHEFKELESLGSIVLVFGAGEEDLRSIEGARPLFSDLGVTPVVVMDRRCGSAVSLSRRLGLSLPLVVDPKGAIGGLYNSIDPLNHRHSPAYFVLDEKGTIRAIGRGLPDAIKLLAVTARGLGRPMPESAWSAMKS